MGRRVHCFWCCRRAFLVGNVSLQLLQGKCSFVCDLLHTKSSNPFGRRDACFGATDQHGWWPLSLVQVFEYHVPVNHLCGMHIRAHSDRVVDVGSANSLGRRETCKLVFGGSRSRSLRYCFVVSGSRWLLCFVVSSLFCFVSSLFLLCGPSPTRPETVREGATDNLISVTI